MSELAIGIDLGGTDIKSGLVASDGRVVARRSVPTEADCGVAHVLDKIVCEIEVLRALAPGDSGGIAAVGVGAPGTLSHRRGVVISPPNLPGWRDVPIVDRVGSVTGLRVVLENDANNAVWGEYVCGAGRGARGVVMLTLGTGIGGGIVVDGRLHRGVHESAAELGHTIVEIGGRPCACGQRGCLEAYASAANTAARAAELLDAGETSCLGEIVARGEALTAAAVSDAAAAGDVPASRVWSDTCRYLAVACINIWHGFDPDRILLAGGMSAAGRRLLDPVRAGVESMASTMFGEGPDIRIAELGNDAGFVGAALRVFRDV